MVIRCVKTGKESGLLYQQSWSGLPIHEGAKCENPSIMASRSRVRHIVTTIANKYQLESLNFRHVSSIESRPKSVLDETYQSIHSIPERQRDAPIPPTVRVVKATELNSVNSTQPSLSYPIECHLYRYSERNSKIISRLMRACSRWSLFKQQATFLRIRCGMPAYFNRRYSREPCPIASRIFFQRYSLKVSSDRPFKLWAIRIHPRTSRHAHTAWTARPRQKLSAIF